MENEVFERNYERDKSETDSYVQKIFDASARPGGFFDTYSKLMDAIPKYIVQQDKENYEYLLKKCDELARRWGGRIRGVVDYQKWVSHIEVILPFFEFDCPEELELLKEIAEKSHTVLFEPTGDNQTRMVITINYFDELCDEDEKHAIFSQAFNQQEDLSALIRERSALLLETNWDVVVQLNSILDHMEHCTGEDRTALLQCLLKKLRDVDPEDAEFQTKLEAAAEQVIHEYQED